MLHLATIQLKLNTTSIASNYLGEINIEEISHGQIQLMVSLIQKICSQKNPHSIRISLAREDS